MGKVERDGPKGKGNRPPGGRKIASGRVSHTPPPPGCLEETGVGLPGWALAPGNALGLGLRFLVMGYLVE